MSLVNCPTLCQHQGKYVPVSVPELVFKQTNKRVFKPEVFFKVTLQHSSEILGSVGTLSKGTEHCENKIKVTKSRSQPRLSRQSNVEGAVEKEFEVEGRTQENEG